jgi:hypothetical protein
VLIAGGGGSGLPIPRRTLSTLLILTNSQTGQQILTKVQWKIQVVASAVRRIQIDTSGPIIRGSNLRQVCIGPDSVCVLAGPP